jgi:hypothetical protein
MLTQLNPPIPVYIPDRKETGLAYGWCDYGPDHDLIWIVAMSVSMEWWAFRNDKVRAVKNITFGRVPKKHHESELEAFGHALDAAMPRDDEEIP